MEDIVISGISGAFPKSENVEEFKEHLLNGECLIEEIDRWDTEFNDVPSRIGPMKSFNRFDHSFFRVHRSHVEDTNVASRILLEKCFEAVVDAGYNAQQIKGTNTVVFYGAYSDAMVDSSGYVLSNLRAITANRISYMLDLKGSSMAIDTGCSSTMYAIDCAYTAIRNGICDAAIVCGANVNCSPILSREFLHRQVLDKNGICRPFDADAQGFARGEAVVAIFIQKITNARRVYATIIHSKTNCDGFKEEGVNHPSGPSHETLYREFYREINIDPNLVSYIETHGTGTAVGDVVEVNAIEKVFCTQREQALQIGSIKSNMGHGEACSALCGLIKMIISFETGTIVPHVNLKTLNPKIGAFFNGNVQIVTKPIPCRGEYFAINSFGIGGSNGHLLISPFRKEKPTSTPHRKDNLPRLVTISGRTEEAVRVFMKALEKNHEDDEFIRLIHEIFSEPTNGHLYRGYIILDFEQNEHKTHIKHIADKKRPIWYIFSGMGSQWPSMGRSLMNIPLFANSIEKSHRILEQKGVNLIDIITTENPQIFDNILHSFVGIVAIQIALVDVLKAIDLMPDGIIGHSVGEIACAYADGCLTTEQTILSAYYRGLVSVETQFVHGTMAAVGAGYNMLKDILPPEIDVACHNARDNCTISGPTDTVVSFIEELKQKNIFVRAVNTSHIAYHSRYIAEAGPKLLSHLYNLIPSPKARSEKWISTSTLERDWETTIVRYASAEYFTNNLLHSVYFEESSTHIPTNAITIEIAPYGILQAILKRSLPSTVDKISLVAKNHQDNVHYLLSSLGQLYELGCTPKLSNLYPPVDFPVSKGTPMISPLIKWLHDEEWPVPSFKSQQTATGERDVVISLQQSEHEYLTGHTVDERNLFPGAGYVELVWETMANMRRVNIKELPIVFENVRFERATEIPKKGKISLHVSIQESGHFEVTENKAIVASGIVRVPSNVNSEKVNIESNYERQKNPDIVAMNNEDFYKELRLRKYQYKGLFKQVHYYDSQEAYAEIQWDENFVSFMDTMAQLHLFHHDTRELLIPTYFRKLVIDVKTHFEILDSLDKEKPVFPVRYYPNLELISSRGIQIINPKISSMVVKKDHANLILEKHLFVPYTCDELMKLENAVRLCVHIVLENVQTLNIKTIELLDESFTKPSPYISTFVAKVLDDFPLIRANVMIKSNSTIKAPEGITILSKELPNDKTYLIAILSNISEKIHEMEKIFDTLADDGFIIALEPITNNLSLETFGLTTYFSRRIDNGRILLLRKVANKKPAARCVKVQNTTFSWIQETQKILSLENNNDLVVLYAENEPHSGILGLFNCLRKEKNGTKTRCFFLMDQNMPTFSLDNTIYGKQYEKNMSQNVFKNGHWGSYRHCLVEPTQYVETEHICNTLQKRGDLSTLKWVEGPLKSIDSSSKSLIQVYYGALNFRDIMLTTGKISPVDTPMYNRLVETYHGLEFSGKDKNGNRVFGIAPYQAITSLIEANPDLMWRVPDNMTLAEASTIGIAYLTVVHAFKNAMNLKNGSSVLIHAATGAVGQAAIHICLHHHCDIFLTVGTPEKKEFIRNNFPQIPEQRIGNSRDTSFEKMIMEQTNGRGVDVVLNSLAEEKLHASLRCVARQGHFIEIGRFDMVKNNTMQMGPLLKGISFHSVILDDYIVNPSDEQKRYQKQLQEMLDNGVIEPLCKTIFHKDEIQSAFRYMAAGKHVGKVVIQIREEENANQLSSSLLIAQPRVYCSAKNSYIIIGGLGGFGLELVDWLIIRGARNIVINSRNRIKNGYQSYKVRLWKSYGVNVVISVEDVTSEIGVEQLLQKAIELGPVAGIFNVAVILKDGGFHTQTKESFEISFAPKAIAITHLDKLSRRMCPSLEHFVIFSSISCGLGNADQTNYGMANSIMERICETRRLENLPALAIQWGAIGDVGLISSFAEDDRDVIIGGTRPQKIASCLETLDSFMKQPNPIVASMVVAEKRYVDTDIVQTIANILGIKDLKTISSTWTFPELGMDSIMSIEIKQIIETEFEIFLTSQDLRCYTFDKLRRMMDHKQRTSDIKIEAKHQSLLFDEKTWNEPLIRIPFLDDKSNSEVSTRENITAFVFPGSTAIAKTMEPLAKNLNIQLLCFQYLFGEYDFVQMCEYFSQMITDRLNTDQQFHLIAYSFGTIFSLEVARILEKRGYRGYLWLIDGSPKYLKSLLTNDSNIANNQDNELQNYACVWLTKILTPGQSVDQLLNQLKKCHDWESKKNLCYSKIPTKLPNKLLDKAFWMAKQSRIYEFHGEPLDARCILIRSTDDIYELDKCYGLSKYFKNSVEIYHVNADHYKIIEKKETADVIMNHAVWEP